MEGWRCGGVKGELVFSYAEEEWPRETYKDHERQVENAFLSLHPLLLEAIVT